MAAHLYFWIEVPMAPSINAMRDSNSSSRCAKASDLGSGSSHSCGHGPSPRISVPIARPCSTVSALPAVLAANTQVMQSMRQQATLQAFAGRARTVQQSQSHHSCTVEAFPQRPPVNRAGRMLGTDLIVGHRRQVVARRQGVDIVGHRVQPRRVLDLLPQPLQLRRPALGVLQPVRYRS